MEASYEKLDFILGQANFKTVKTASGYSTILRREDETGKYISVEETIKEKRTINIIRYYESGFVFKTERRY